MIHERIWYSDGHDVTVTDSFFEVKKLRYQLKGITKHGFYVIHPDRLTPFLVLLLGGMLVTLGAFQLMPRNWIRDFEFYSIVFNINSIALGVGIGMFVLGAILLLLMHDRYAIWIATAEGEKKVVVSSKREYINQILDALNHAFFNLISPARLPRNVGEQHGRSERK